MEDRQLAVSALAANRDGVVAVGTNEALFAEPGNPQFIAWRSVDGVAWTQDPIADDVVDTAGGHVAIGPAGPVAIAEATNCGSPDPIVFRFTDGAWHRVVGPVPQKLTTTQRLLPP